jgi:hypothetical protein
MGPRWGKVKIMKLVMGGMTGTSARLNYHLAFKKSIEYPFALN